MPEKTVGELVAQAQESEAIMSQFWARILDEKHLPPEALDALVLSTQQTLARQNFGRVDADTIKQSIAELRKGYIGEPEDQIKSNLALRGISYADNTTLPVPLRYLKQLWTEAIAWQKSRDSIQADPEEGAPLPIRQILDEDRYQGLV